MTRYILALIMILVMFVMVSGAGEAVEPLAPEPQASTSEQPRQSPDQPAQLPSDVPVLAPSPIIPSQAEPPAPGGVQRFEPQRSQMPARPPRPPRNQTVPPSFAQPQPQPPQVNGQEQPARPPQDQKKPEERIPKKGNVIIDFPGGDIKQLIRVFSELLEKNITYDESINGSVSLIGPEEVSVWEARRIFEGALQVMGYTVVWSWPVSKIVPLSEVKNNSRVPVVY